MKIKFLGTGGAFTMKNWQTNMLIEAPDNPDYPASVRRLLIDAGSDIRFSLAGQGLNFSNIDSVYLTHLHGDHCAGLEYLAFCSYFSPKSVMPQPIKMFGHQTVINLLWDGALRAGLASIQGKVVGLHDYFNVQMLPDNGEFYWQGIRFSLIQSIHIMNGYSVVPSYGLMIHSPTSTKKLYITADSQYAPEQLIDFYKQADLIIQDCETAPYASRVHAHYNQLCGLPPEIKSRMLLVHYGDNVMKSDGSVEDTAVEKAKTDGFKGYATRQMEIDW